jgi:hypothetical protein
VEGAEVGVYISDHECAREREVEHRREVVHRAHYINNSTSRKVVLAAMS